MAVLTLDVAVAEFAKQIDLAVQLVMERLALDLWNKITLRTPVDTGRARASWQLSIGAPSLVVSPSLGPYTGKNSKLNTPPGEPAAPFPTDVEITGDDIVFICNSLPYIEALEDGHSQQAIAGMVQVSLAEVMAEIELLLEGIKEQAQAQA